MTEYNDLPTRIIFGCLKGVSTSDAEMNCKSLVEKYCNEPADASFFIKKHGNDVFYEIQELGNGKAFLPGILDIINESEEQTFDIVIPSATKNFRIHSKEGFITYVMLPQHSNIEVTKGLKRSSSMKPYQNDNRYFYYIGIATFIMGLAVMLSSYVTYMTSDRIDIKAADNSFNNFYETLNIIQDNDSNIPEFYTSKFYYDESRKSWEQQMEIIENIDEIKNEKNKDKNVIENDITNALPEGFILPLDEVKNEEEQE